MGVSGGGTHRAGQAAFGNMCRKGRMFAPTKTWRKWHQKINVNQRRFAVASALAASAIPALVLARGHRIEQTPECPLVLSNDIQSTPKTAKAAELLKKFGASADVDKVKASRQIRRGKGKMRNRRHTQRRGPLVIYGKDDGIVKAFRNLPGVELVNVSRLNLLLLAPGGHVGRFCIWTQSAFEKLDSLYGTHRKPSAKKNNYTLPRPKMTNPDVARLINSDEIQSVVRPTRTTSRVHSRVKRNPLKNNDQLIKLNPYAKTLKRNAVRTMERARKARDAHIADKRKGVAKKTKVSKADKEASKKRSSASKAFFKTLQSS